MANVTVSACVFFDNQSMITGKLGRIKIESLRIKKELLFWEVRMLALQYCVRGNEDTLFEQLDALGGSHIRYLL